jgi:hypothetical protein
MMTPSPDRARRKGKVVMIIAATMLIGVIISYLIGYNNGFRQGLHNFEQQKKHEAYVKSELERIHNERSWER